MRTRLLVISDLHLGGAEGFQMCTAAGRKRLAQFIDWAGTQKTERNEVRLVLNGDIVDFLAERNDSGAFDAFTMDELEALRKFRRIADNCEEFFSSLVRYLRSGAALTLLLGNHDIELTLPAVRREFLRRIGPGHVEFLYDNEAFSLGSVLIEHGNRYDAWNMVNHNQLRKLRSQISRREEAALFYAQPGSELVAGVMNPLKGEFAFVDLLKPETGAVLPILAVLKPTDWKKAASGLRQYVGKWFLDGFDSQGLPVDDDYIAADSAPKAAASRSELPPQLSDPFLVADELASQVLPEEDTVSAWENLAIPVLLRAFRARRRKAESSFVIEQEEEEYETAAQTHARHGFQVVLFGHTHLAKRISLSTNGAVYLNTGTWSDLMRLPREVYSGKAVEGEKALREFLERVKKNDIAGFRRQVPTFAQIDLDSKGGVERADVFFFDADGTASSITTEGLEKRLI